MVNMHLQVEKMVKKITDTHLSIFLLYINNVCIKYVTYKVCYHINNVCIVGAPPKELVGAPDQMTVSQHSKSEGWHPSLLSPIKNFCLKNVTVTHLVHVFCHALLFRHLEEASDCLLIPPMFPPNQDTVLPSLSEENLSKSRSLNDIR